MGYPNNRVETCLIEHCSKFQIQKSKLQKGDTLEILKFSFCADKEQVIKSFASIGIPIKSEEDLPIIVEWHKKGYDLSGKLKNINGEFLKLDIDNYIKNVIKLRHDKVLNCKIKIID